MQKLRAFVYRLIGLTKWRITTRGRMFVKTRYLADEDRWEERELTEDEADEAAAWQANR